MKLDKQTTVVHEGITFTAEAVTRTSETDYIKRIKGDAGKDRDGKKVNKYWPNLSEADYEKQLKTVYAKCKEALAKDEPAKAEAPADNKSGKTSK